MSGHAYAGPVAGLGFAIHCMLTGLFVVIAAWQASRARMISDRRWATQTYLLLCAPLLLRLISGAAAVSNFEDQWVYQLTAWVSWLSCGKSGESLSQQHGT
ncbi:DUF2306 domain-containing protein [Stieleria varia]|uniref:DUF2306 domain-containing protein n=1 Tax=Stieleria varia TaxID=2528005 RepID=UPI0011B5FB35